MRTTTPLTAGAQRIPASGIREIFNLALQDPDILHLEVGEPDFATPAHIVEAAHEAARAGSGYTATPGILAVREAACARVARVHGVAVDPANMLVTQGGVQAISTAIGAFTEPGDEVLIPDPAWPNYAMMIASHSGGTVRYPLRAANAFFPDPDEVASLITPRTKVLVVNSPANPTGAVIPSATLERLVEVARSAGVLVVSDEVYDEVVFDASEPVTLRRFDPDGVISVWSCSKTYAMTGWRVGYMAVPAGYVTAFVAIMESVISCVSSITQAAALAAFEGPQACIAEMRDAYAHRRDVLMGLLDSAGIGYVRPEGAFYLMMSLSSGADSRAAALDLVRHGVAVAPGTAFGDVASDAMRISLASSEETITAAAARIAEWYARTDGGLAVQH
jgi:aspartate/methionine/tyrosine aminotransferase